MNLIVWINGPFGVGKTTVAERLAVLWPTALVFDPECVGTMLRRLIPLELQSDDYQDMPIWRRLVRTTAIGLLADYKRPLIVPMTLVVPEYFEEIVGELRRAGTAHVAHFTLPRIALGHGDVLRGRPSAVQDRLRDRPRRSRREEALAALPSRREDMGEGEAAIRSGRRIAI